MTIFSIIGIAIVCTAITVLLRQYHPEMAMLTALMGGAIIFFLVLAELSPILTQIEDLFQKASIDSGSVKMVIKSLGICYITGLAADVCRDAGQTAAAGKVELAGKISIVALSMPLFLNLVDTALSLIAP